MRFRPPDIGRGSVRRPPRCHAQTAAPTPEICSSGKPLLTPGRDRRCQHVLVSVADAIRRTLRQHSADPRVHGSLVAVPRCRASAGQVTTSPSERRVKRPSSLEHGHNCRPQEQKSRQEHRHWPPCAVDGRRPRWPGERDERQQNGAQSDRDPAVQRESPSHVPEPASAAASVHCLVPAENSGLELRGGPSGVRRVLDAQGGRGGR